MNTSNEVGDNPAEDDVASRKIFVPKFWASDQQSNHGVTLNI
jgi:hypothetical protein